jgi:endo-1,4-beta-xylanase
MRTRFTPRLATAVAAVVALTAPVPAAAQSDPPPVTVISSDFEDGTAQGWAPRAGETVTATAEAARTGGFGLAVTGRTQTWQGPTLNVLDTMEGGVRYTLTVWTRLAAGEPAGQLRMSVERRSQGTPSFETVVGNTNVTADGWVRLQGTYTLAHQVDFLTVYIESASGTPSLHIDDFEMTTVPLPPIQQDIPNLKDVLAGSFPIGAAIGPVQILGQHAELLAKHFNSVTPGNALKWDATEPVEGQFRFADPDAMVDFARTHGMQVRGHTLVWHNQTPAWVFQDASGNPLTSSPEHKALLLQRLDNHIRAVMGRYAGEITAWDVVNEVIDENQPDGLRRSRWYEIAGPDYIRTAFQVAREVDPDAALFINDFNTNIPAKREALFNLVSQLRGEGVPIDGVGHQMHINIDWPSVAETEQMLQRFIPLGVDQQITEMDISIYTNSGESFPTPPTERLVTQGHRYQAMFDLYREYEEQISSVTVWGLADDDTWLDSFPVARKDAPLLFDVRLQAKPAYWGIVDPTRVEEAACGVRYSVAGQWPGRFQGGVTVTNTASTPVSGWELAWSFLDGQRITTLWNGDYHQVGADVTVANARWNGTVAPGASVSFGFLGRWTGANTVPASFTLNGSTCASE